MVFEDVIMCFSREEWKHLSVTQTLNGEVMMESFALPGSLCCQCAMEDEETLCKQVSEKSCMCGESGKIVRHHWPSAP